MIPTFRQRGFSHCSWTRNKLSPSRFKFEAHLDIWRQLKAGGGALKPEKVSSVGGPALRVT